MQCAATDVFSYAQATVTKSAADDRPPRHGQQPGAGHRQPRRARRPLQPDRHPRRLTPPGPEGIGRALRTEARFPRASAATGPATTRASTEGNPARRRAGRLDPPHGPQAPRRAAQRLGLVHALRRRRAGPAGVQADLRRGGAHGSRRGVHPGRRRRCSSRGARAGAVAERRDRGVLGPGDRARAGGLSPPAVLVPLLGAAAEDEVPVAEPVARSSPARSPSTASRSSSMGGRE